MRHLWQLCEGVKTTLAFGAFPGQELLTAASDSRKSIGIGMNFGVHQLFKNRSSGESVVLSLRCSGGAFVLFHGAAHLQLAQSVALSTPGPERAQTVFQIPPPSISKPKLPPLRLVPCLATMRRHW
ncbi:hypothetical protein L249_4200 [Ophiocordyceps polyrhachis-furcata BCC 54312]|uniref:Uncharacterized protein n=1 Tax=Ophiocordyceps polyrhachis-furcata BCC 54312 TaxID=1330021 RepID=A0A367LBV2_9HYPO|nr:hypothetical protein L249_4200 [Ophiocordyceps polyrhachis-furcata BCC 54312]